MTFDQAFLDYLFFLAHSTSNLNDAVSGASSYYSSSSYYYYSPPYSYYSSSS